MRGACVASRISRTSVPALFIVEFPVSTHGNAPGAAAAFDEESRRPLSSDTGGLLTLVQHREFIRDGVARAAEAGDE